MTGTYTVSSSENTSQLSVSSFTINSVSDVVGNSMTSTIVPTGSNMFSDKVIVMNKEKIIEYGSATDILQNPKNDYTKELVSSSLSINS